MKKYLILALLSTTLLMAEETEIVPVGTRSLSSQERVAHQQERLERDVSAKKLGAPRGVAIEYSSHNGAYHHPVMIQPLGDLITLEDGSSWIVNYPDRSRTLNWLTSDVIKIIPNRAWFSSYYFIITNITTSESVEVNLAQRPAYNGIYTYWIVALDYYNHQVCLSDGSVWNMASFDHNVLNKWLPSDTVIIGHNTGFFTASRPNILINCETETYAEGRCTY